MPTANALEILITARDNASKSLAVISTNVGGIGTQADLAANKVGAFGASLVKAASSEVTTRLQQISGSIVEIGQKAPSALVATGKGFLTLVTAIQSNATALELFQQGIVALEKDLIGSKRSLVDIKDALLDTAKLFTGIDLNKDAKGSFVSAIKEIEAVAVNQNIVKASDVVKKFVNELSFKAGEKTGNFLADVYEGFERISSGAGDALSEVTNFTKNLAIGGLAGVLQVSPDEIKNLANADIAELERVANRAKELAKEDIEAFIGLPFEQIKELAKEDIEAFNQVGEKVKGKLKSIIGEDQFNSLGEKATNTFDSIFSRFFQGSQEGISQNVKEIEASVDETLQTSLGRKLANAGIEAGAKIASGIGGAVNSTLNGIDKLLNNIENRVDKIRNVQKFSGYIQQVTLSPAGLPGAEELGQLKEKTAELLGSLGNVGQELFFLTYGIQQFASVFSAPYEAFIGQNVKLQETLLSTQAQIVATNKVFKNGIEITNATEGIKALGETSKRTIDQIRKDSLELVGVTSQDLIQQLLPVVTRNLAQLGGQLGDVPKLVSSLGASLQNLGLSLPAASQELTSIATASIDINSQLAKSLNLTNSQVALYKQQGRLIPELTARLQPFVEGNALAAAQIGGVSSNLAEVFQLITQKAGETFLDPIVKRLGDVYKLVDPTKSEGIKNFKTIQDIVSGIAKSLFDGIVKLADGIGSLLKSIVPAIVGFIQVGAKTIGDLLGFVGDTLTGLANGPLKYLGAALGALSQYAEVFTGIFKIGLFLKIRDVIFGLVVGGFGLLAKTLPIVGSLFGLFALRSNEAVLALTNLRTASNTSVASLLTFGKNINFIPGAVEGVAKSIPLVGAGIAQALPQISQFGIALIALGQKFPIIGAIFKSLDVAIPKIVGGLANIAIAFIKTADAALQAGVSLGLFQKAGLTIAAGLNTEPIIAGLQRLTTGTKVSTIAINGFGKSIGGLRSTIVSTFASFAVSSALFFAIFQLFEKFQPLFEAIGKKLSEVFSGLVTVLSFFKDAIAEAFKQPLIYLPLVTAGIFYLATAIGALNASLIATIATQITGWFVGLAGVLGGLTGTTVVLAGRVTTLAAALRFVGAAEGVTALSRAFFVLGPAIASALAPLAVLAAGISAIYFTRRYSNPIRGFFNGGNNKGDEEEEQSATDIYSKLANEQYQANINALAKVKKAKEEEQKATAQGLRLTKEQYAENAKTQKQVQDRIALTESVKKDIEASILETKDPIEAAKRTKDVEELTKQLETLKSQVGDIAIAAKDLPQYGSALQQFSRNVETAKRALLSASGDPAIFAKQIEALLDSSKQLQESGLINADEAAKTYASIATNASVDAQTQIKAQQAITEAYKIESQKRIDLYDTQFKRIQALVATGKISEAEAIAQTTDVTLKKLAEERDALNKTFLARKEITEKTTQDAVNAAKKEQAIADLKIAAAKGDPTKLAEFKESQLGDVDKQRKELDAKRVEAQKQLEELQRLNPNEGARSLKVTEDLKQAAEKVRGLQDELEKLDKYRDTLDKTIKVDKNAVNDVKALPQQIEEARQKLEALKEEKAIQETVAERNAFTDSRSKRGGRRVRIEEKQGEIDAQQAQISALESRLTSARNALTPDAKKEKEALGERQLAIDAANKAQSSKEKALAEEKRKLDKALDDSILEAKKELATQQIKILDAQIKTALDKEKLGETQRLAELAKLRKSGVKLESEVRLSETQEKKKQIQTELELQKQKLAQFAVLEKKGVGVSQADRLATQTRIAELTKSLTDTELEAINNLTAAIRDRLTLAANQYGVAIEQANLKLERQKLLYTALEKSLENQGRLADSSKKLSDSIVAVREADLNVLTKIYDKQQQAIRDAGGAGNFADLEIEEKKKILTEQMAKIKLESLLRQQTFEKESLEREIQKRDLLLERQKIENKIRTESAKVDLAIAQVDVKAAEAEVKQRPNSPEARLKLEKARLEQQKKELGFAGLIQEGGFLEETGRINRIQADQERTTLNNNQSAALLGAQGEFIGSIRDDAKREQLLASFQSQLSLRNPQRGLSGTEIDELLRRRPSQAQGASFVNPTADLLRRSGDGTLTTAPAKTADTGFATSFEELQKKYADTGLGSIEDLNKKFGGKDPQTFKELEAKYSGKPVTQQETTTAIASSFDNLNKQIDEGFTKTLVAPQMKVEEMTTKLEEEFNRVSKQITENPVQLKLDEKQLEDQLKKLEKPIAVLDEKQLARLEAIATALGVGGQNVNPQTAQNAAQGIGTVNANVTVNQQGNIDSVAGVDVKAGVRDALDSILKRVAGVTSGTK